MIVNVPIRSVAADMTDQEKTAYNDFLEALHREDLAGIGTAEEAVLRGAEYLDRCIPDWFERVEINSLDLGSTCNCVLGQIFAPVTSQETYSWNDNRWAISELFEFTYADGVTSYVSAPQSDGDDGFLLGKLAFGFTSTGPEDFFGFDYADGLWDYDDLTDGWVCEIEKRKATAASA